MRKIFTIVLICIVAIGLIACSNQPAAPAGESQTPAPAPSQGQQNDDPGVIRIAYLYQSLSNEHVVIMQGYVKDAVKSIGGIELIELDGEGQIDKQLAQAENMISQGVDVLVLNPYDKNGCAPIVEMAAAANVPIVIASGEVVNVELATSWVGTNDKDAGIMQTEYMADLLGGKGTVVVIHGPNGHAAEIGRTLGMNEVLENFPNIGIYAEQTANWDRAEALTLMENWLQTGTQIDGVLAQNDEMALGALTAVEAAGKLGEIKIIGIDAIPDALAAVKKGTLDATVFQDTLQLGEMSIKVAVAIAKGDEFPKKLMIPFKIVNSDNVDEYIH